MSKKIKYIVNHCTATPPSVNDNYDIYSLMRAHLGPKRLDDGTYRYKGRNYKTIMDLPDEKIGNVHIRRIRGRGWKVPGYYALVLTNGAIQYTFENDMDDTVDPWEITNGARGFNLEAVHICYVGGIDEDGSPKDTRTAAQKRSLLVLNQILKRIAPQAQIIGHRDLPGVAKACPSFDAKKEYAKIQ